MTIVAVGYSPPGDLNPDQGGGVSLPTDVARHVEAVTQAVGPLLADGNHVLVIHPDWHDDEVRRSLEVARLALDTHRLILHATPAPPLAGGLLAATAAALATRGAQAGPLASFLPALSASILPLAWLGSVTRLAHPTPSMAQHVRSLLPGAGFVAIAGANPRIERADRREPSLPLDSDLRGHRIALAARPEGALTWVERALADRGCSADVLRLPATPLGPQWWGTDELVELAVFPSDLDQLADAVGPAVPCAWCGEPVGGRLCPLCRMRQPTGTGSGR